jgi:UDP-N-acetylglucosamine 2-epimerase (non-hydrolysing)
MAVFGTRPDAIKMAPVIKELARFPEAAKLTVVATGQHREMLQQVLDALGLRCDLNLDIMEHGQTPAAVLARALEGLEQAIRDQSPDLVIAQGDTSTTFAASLAAFYNKVQFAHVEAGLRTDDKYQPFPEEVNRRLTGVITDLHFAPTLLARRNLLREGMPENRVWVTGNTSVDAVRLAASMAGAAAPRHRRIVLVTAHRRENWGEPLVCVCDAIRRLLERFPDVEVVVPMHRNPDVREIWNRELAGQERIELTEPPAYADFVALMKASTIILTDSGGVQEEAPGLGKPVLVLRNKTERPEGIEAGVAKLVGLNADTIYGEAERLLSSRDAYEAMAKAQNPYGDGRAAQRIRTVIFDHFGIQCDAHPVGQWEGPGAGGES